MKNKNSKKETYKKVGIGVGLVIVVAAIILLLLRSCGAPANDPGGIEFDPSATEGGWDEADMDAIRDSLNEKVDEHLAGLFRRRIGRQPHDCQRRHQPLPAVRRDNPQ